MFRDSFGPGGEDICPSSGPVLFCLCLRNISSWPRTEPSPTEPELATKPPSNTLALLTALCLSIIDNGNTASAPALLHFTLAQVPSSVSTSLSFSWPTTTAPQSHPDRHLCLAHCCMGLHGAARCCFYRAPSTQMRFLITTLILLALPPLLTPNSLAGSSCVCKSPPQSPQSPSWRHCHGPFCCTTFTFLAIQLMWRTAKRQRSWSAVPCTWYVGLPLYL